MFDVIKKRKLLFSISGGAVLLSLVAVLVFGLQLGIDFTGGTEVQVEFAGKQPEIAQFEAVLVKAIGKEKGQSVRTALSKPAFLIRSRSLDDDKITALRAAIAEQATWQANISQVTTIGPNVGGEFLRRAYWALALSIIGIILFVAWAFRSVPDGYSSFKFGVVAIVALVHDVVIIIGLFAVLGFLRNVEVDALFITALLTVLGFSVNDTIVVFDRLREDLQRNKKHSKKFAVVSNNAVKSTLRRSLFTSLSTLIVLLALLAFFLGFESLFFFFLALAMGVVVGTYSSVFLAIPLLYVWHQ